MWHLACVCCKTCRTFGGVQPPRDQSQCECHKITKYHLADFVGGELKNILTDAAGPDWWQLQILNFWVNLQNSNCISYCVAWPPLTGHWTPGLDTGHSVTKLWKHNLSRPLACERAWPKLSQTPAPLPLHPIIHFFVIKHHCHILSMWQRDLNELDVIHFWWKITFQLESQQFWWNFKRT